MGTRLYRPLADHCVYMYVLYRIYTIHIYAQTLKWAWQRSFEGRNLALNWKQTNECSKVRTFFPALV